MDDHKSTELKDLFTALSLAQSEIKVAVKDSSNPFFKSKYANLQAVIESSRPALCKNGLSVAQQIISDDGLDYLVTMLCHSSGQWISSKMRITPAKTDVQSLGSYITYLRRYCYSSLVGVYDGEEDDDGHQAVVHSTKKISQTQLKVLMDMEQDMQNYVLKQCNVKQLSDLSEDDATRVISILQKRPLTKG